MASPVGIRQLEWFYPLGNTPARSLTQDLPKESDASILSLGSRDIRHVLFTSHLEPLRSIVVTCVDNDSAIIARNVLMLSLILEGKDNWEIYHHTKISQQSLQVIHVQAQKLFSVSWDGRIQFLDDVTLQKVRGVWETYATKPDMKTAFDIRNEYVDNKTVDFTLLRALAPLQFLKSPDFFKYQDKFWKTGSLDGIGKWPNPLFGSQSVMHYERKLLDVGLAYSGSPRLDFKESLLSIYMLASGVQGQRGYVQLHSLNNEASGGIAVAIFVDKLRLDMSNQTVLVDAAILPVLKSDSSTIPSIIASWISRGFNQIKTNDKELELWKQVLPAYIERCRTWPHTKDCELQKADRIPLTYVPNESFFCTCGNGKFPKGYLKDLPNWPKIAPYCVRAAISPCFAVPYVEEIIDVDAIKKSIDECSYCKKKAATGNKSLKECGRCHAAKYCSQECQKKDWTRHKQICKVLTEEVAKAATEVSNEDHAGIQPGQNGCSPS